MRWRVLGVCVCGGVSWAGWAGGVCVCGGVSWAGWAGLGLAGLGLGKAKPPLIRRGLAGWLVSLF